MASLSVSSALWLTATSANPIGVSLAAQSGVKISFGTWLLAASVPALATILLLPLILCRLFPPGVNDTPDAPAMARKELSSMGRLSRDEWIVAVTFAVMVTGWVMADTLRLSLPAVAFAGLGVLLATNVLTLDDINLQGSTLVTFFWLAVLFALSGQLNELGFMGYVGGKLTALLGGVAWPIAYVVLLVLYVLMHVREPVGAGARALRRIPRCRRAHRCPHISDGIRAAVCQQLLLDDYSARGKSERHFCWQQLLDSGRALPARVFDYILLPTCISGVGDAVAAFGRKMTRVDNVTIPRRRSRS
jgi:Na+/H+ antiporter NhaD/arsenite permease-like protein